MKDNNKLKQFYAKVWITAQYLIIQIRKKVEDDVFEQKNNVVSVSSTCSTSSLRYSGFESIP